MSTFLHVSIVTLTLTINPRSTKGIEWTVDQKVYSYGQNLTLFCNIGNCCLYPAGWEKWNYNDFTAIYIDVRNLTYDVNGNVKYGASANKSGIFLTINNLKEDDLKIEYSCSYDFTFSERKSMQKTEAFKEIEWVVDQKVSSYGQDLTLFCNVGKCCTYQHRWSKWNSGAQFMELYLNEDNDMFSRYNEKINKSGFFLTIRNLSETDLDTAYSCFYNNRQGKRKYLRKSDAFYEKTLSMNHEQNHIMSIELTLLIAISTGVAVAVILTVAVYKCIQTGSHRRPRINQGELVHDQNSPQGTTQQNEHTVMDDVSMPRNRQHTSLPNPEEEALLLDNHTLQQGTTDCDDAPHENRHLAQSGYKFEKSSSDQHISQTLKSPQLRTTSSSVNFNNKKEAVILQDVFTSSCSSGVMNTELPNLNVFKKTTFSDSSANSSLKLSSMSTSSWEI